MWLFNVASQRVFPSNLNRIVNDGWPNLVFAPAASDGHCEPYGT